MVIKNIPSMAGLKIDDLCLADFSGVELTLLSAGRVRAACQFRRCQELINLHAGHWAFGTESLIGSCADDGKARLRGISSLIFSDAKTLSGEMRLLPRTFLARIEFFGKEIRRAGLFYVSLPLLCKFRHENESLLGAEWLFRAPDNKQKRHFVRKYSLMQSFDLKISGSNATKICKVQKSLKLINHLLLLFMPCRI